MKQQSPHRALGQIYDNIYSFKFDMKKAKRWTSIAQYAEPRDKQHDQSIGAFNYRQISRFIGLFL